jgi:hypothetical protein
MSKFLRPQQRRHQIGEQQNGEHNDDNCRDSHSELPQLLAALDVPECDRKKGDCKNESKQIPHRAFSPAQVGRQTSGERRIGIRLIQ